MSPLHVPLPPLGTSACSEIVSALAAGDGGPWGVYQVGGSESAVARLAQQVEEQVFYEEYGVTPSALSEEFSPYNDRSVWSLLVNHDTMLPVASLRSVVGPGKALKAAHDVETFFGTTWEDVCAAAGHDPSGRFIEHCTMSILPEWRTSDKRWPLKVAIAVQLHLMDDVQSVASVQIINPRALRLIKMYGCPFETVAGPADIEGADFVVAFLATQSDGQWFTTKDSEAIDLVRQRSEAGRGGTRLEPIDLDGPVALRHHNLVVERDRVAAEADASSAL